MKLFCQLCGGSTGTIIPYKNFEVLAHEYPLNCIEVLVKRIAHLEQTIGVDMAVHYGL
jgi:hypothetical protein